MRLWLRKGLENPRILPLKSCTQLTSAAIGPQRSGAELIQARCLRSGNGLVESSEEILNQ
jgi:hypothetical protein